jgi:cytochrome c-type biogenesis protein
VEFSIVAIFAAGVLTFASPCVLPLIPVYISILAGSVSSSRPVRPVAPAIAFSAGLSSVFVALGAAASAFGAALNQHRAALLLASGALMILFGLRALGVIRVGVLDREARPALQGLRTAGGLGSAFLFGAAFALGWSPCIGPVLASVLGFAASRGVSALRGAAYLSVYAAGISVPLVIVAAFAPVALVFVRRARANIVRIERATGALMVAVGAWTLWTASQVQPAHGVEARRDKAAEGAVACDAKAGEHVCALPEAGAVAADVREASGARMLEFVSSNCPICARMAPVIAEAERACDGLGARIQRVDVTTAEGRALAVRHRVVGTPTFVFIADDGVEHDRIIGEETTQNLLAVVESSFALRCAARSPHPSHSG